jgi:hypothetical protein
MTTVNVTGDGANAVVTITTAGPQGIQGINQGIGHPGQGIQGEIGPEGPSQDLSPIEGRLAALEALDILLLEG